MNAHPSSPPAPAASKGEFEQLELCTTTRRGFAVGTTRRRDDDTTEFFQKAGSFLEDRMLGVISPLSEREEQVFTWAMDCALAVHRELGSGYREKIYDLAYSLELDSRGLRFEREKKIDVRYKQWVIPGQRIDLVIEGVVLVEIKAVPKLLKLPRV